ncbi:MAG: recombinase family protein [Pseudomonadota bacterium]
MKQAQALIGARQKALIYCRVSDKKQKIDGHGLESQEHRCRQYAEAHGYEVEAIFPDDISGGGDYTKRPGMVALLSYLDMQAGTDYVIIFDDLKRLARDREFHWKLRAALAERGARPESPNFNFDDSPEGEFVEAIMAAQGHLEREQNRRQVIQKMTARVEKGYYVFHPPVGYRYEKTREHGKLLVRDEPVASIIAEALEGFASGKFRSQVEVKRFLESQPSFPTSGKSGYVHPSKVKDILQRAVYAGCVDAPDWGVSLRKGHHEALISLETFDRIQSALKGVVYAPARKDISNDFPLRGFVACDDCGEPMTSCWSKGRNKHYAYYLCDTPNCPSKRKSIARAKVEDGAEGILKGLGSAKDLIEMAKAMFKDAWAARLNEAKDASSLLKVQIKDVEKQIDSLLDRIVDASSASVIKAYEQRIEKLESEKLRLEDKLETAGAPKGHQGEFIEPALEFLASPWNIYKNGGLALRQTVLRLALEEPLRYCRKTGYRTAKISYPFKVLGDFCAQKCEMVGDPGIEPGVRLR